MSLDKPYADVPGTTIFDADQARRGYHLNQFCMSLMKAENRARFKANERAYLDEWPMTRGAEAGPARAELRTADRARRQHLLPRQGLFHRRTDLHSGRLDDDRHVSRRSTGNMMMAGGRPIEGNRYVGEKK